MLPEWGLKWRQHNQTNTKVTKMSNSAQWAKNLHQPLFRPVESDSGTIFVNKSQSKIPLT